ncbi:hypothetical protein [Streptomyces parvulus]|uniref:hypothetical protein n=1 Tax=Streptomyces parvulus TaxID=146923 RepID=UPI00381353F5
MHQYECGNCGLRSESFVTRKGAEKYGKGHRHERHGGMAPISESILTYSGQMPQAGEWKVFLIVAVLIVAGLISKAL